MTTLLVAKDAERLPPVGIPQVGLHTWLQGHWALLFSDPRDFAPPPSTPTGFIVNVAEELRRARTKLVAVINRPQPLRANDWLHQASEDPSMIVLEETTSRDSRVVDFATRVLVHKLLRLERPYVLVLDALGRCRSTILYRAQRINRPRTLHELLCVVTALRGDPATHAAMGQLAG